MQCSSMLHDIDLSKMMCIMWDGIIDLWYIFIAKYYILLLLLLLHTTAWTKYLTLLL